jgi:protein-L-isoaspartate(D-aspartate) O-methyltransferase
MLIQDFILLSICFISNLTNYIPTNILVTSLPNPLYLLNISPATSSIGQTTSRRTTAMAWRCTGRTNAELIANLSAASIISSPRVRAAMTAVDRAHFCPSPSFAYEDSPQTIGYGATISAPHMHASAAESLLPYIRPDRECRVLDIGSGSGYLTAVLAHLVGAEGKVVGIEHIEPLAKMARENMAKSADGRAMLESGKVEFVVGDGRKGYPAEGPYDAIHVGAAAKELHPELVEQLKAPGRMFIPVEDEGGWGSQYIWVVDKDEKGGVKKKRDMGVRYVPLTDPPSR